MPTNYAVLRSKEDADDDNLESEKLPFLPRYKLTFGKQGSGSGSRPSPRFWLTIWTSCNAAFTIFLVIAAVYLIDYAHSLSKRPPPPRSPLHEDGVVRYINTRYKPSKIFQSPPSDEADAAWHGWLEDNDHELPFSTAQAKKLGLPESIEYYKDPGYHVYALGVGHQMHCLNRLRKSFHPDRYYPNASQHELLHHTRHCLDVLRQAILCHADVSLVYWWNSDYSYTDESGARHYTEEYLQMTPKERADGSFVTWDSEVQCRDIDAITRWAQQHKMDYERYGAQMID
ncbi:hypothetical protein BJX99DRAFT_267518 [Aspergillus californicus]